MIPDPEVRFAEILTRLKEHEFRLTPQRLELVRLIAISEGHPSAAQLHAKIREKFPTMSHATVYKTLALLKEMNQVLEIDLRDDRHYDGYRPGAHPHLICTQCNQIVDGELELGAELLKQLEAASGFQILRPQITFYGLCPNCKTST